MLRKKFGNAYLAEKSVEAIALGRADEGYEKVDGKNKLCKNRRKAHLIDSIKHPDEVNLLRDVYGDLFWLIGVFAPESIRKERAGDSIPPKEVVGLFQRDEDEGLSYGQQVRKTMHLADIFIRNDAGNTDRLVKNLERFLHTLFNTKITTPLVDEMAMFSAASAACGSACLSRQVGAAIYNKQGELLGVGKNDPPKFGGGLYSDEDLDKDHRCQKWQEGRCHNDGRKTHLYSTISDAHGEAISRELTHRVESGQIDCGKKILEEICRSVAPLSSQILRNSEIRDLIEFSRAVHAEMEAIISVARKGKSGLIGSTLYCTTFPCHNCARHIIAAGIQKVVFIEPYPKSLAADLHRDAISIDGTAVGDKVHFIQYEGIAPKNMMKLYQMREGRKQDGRAVQHVMLEASPVFRPPLDGFSTYEKMVVSKIQSLEQEKSVNEPGNL